MIIDDSKAIERTLAGDKQAFRTLVEANSRLVYTAVVKIVRDCEAAEDITQEAFFQAYRSLASFRFQSAFSTWLVRIAINKALDHCRQRKNAPQIEALVDYLQDGIEPNPETEILHREVIWQTQEQIQGLPEIYRRVVCAYYFLEFSYREIALQEGISVKTVESRLYRARAMLRRSLLGGEGNVSTP